MKVTACIPARYASSRLPGKPLLKIGDKPMIQWVYEGANSHDRIDDVIVLTDHLDIIAGVEAFNGKVLMTSTNHENGTMRIGEILPTLDTDIVINLQGDEPWLDVSAIDRLLSSFENEDCEIATICAPITDGKVLFDYNKVKVVKDLSGKALYFSRQAIPACRDLPYAKWLEAQKYYLHIGLYAFRKTALERIVQLQKCPLESTENLEQLRWLESGMDIYVRNVEDNQSFGIDTEQDLAKARQIYKNLYTR